MVDGAKSELAEQIAATIDWWRDAGVDGDFSDAPNNWIAANTPPAAVQPEADPVAKAAPAYSPPAAPIDRSTWPDELTAFAPWWLEAAWLDGGQTNGRVPPRGNREAELMVLVAEPEHGDNETLLSGPQGRVLGGMLAAMRLAPDTVYLASVLPRHTPHADWAQMAARGLGDLARHHVNLAAPKRLIVFGSNILPLLGHDPANNDAASSQFDHGLGAIPMLAARDLAVLLERPRWKAGFWHNWLGWTASMETEKA